MRTLNVEASHSRYYYLLSSVILLFTSKVLLLGIISDTTLVRLSTQGTFMPERQFQV